MRKMRHAEIDCVCIHRRAAIFAAPDRQAASTQKRLACATQPASLNPPIPPFFSDFMTHLQRLTGSITGRGTGYPPANIPGR